MKREFSGLGDCIKKIYKREGPFGMYKGFTLALAAASIYRSLYFGLFDSFKNIYKNKIDYYSEKPPMLIQFGIAQVGTPYVLLIPFSIKKLLLLFQSVTIISGLCIYPLDTVNRRLMLESGRNRKMKIFGGTWTAFRVVYINEGFRAFYRVNFL